MFSNSAGGEILEVRLTALDAIVDGLLDDDMTGFSRDDLVEFSQQRFETVLRKATAVGHRAVVEAVERRVPEDLGCRSINDFLIGTLRISAADAACSGTPEEVAKIGAHLLAYLNPDGDAPDEKERRRGLRIGKQGVDLMTPISGLLDPETRALLEPVLAKLARPGMNNPDDPDSPLEDVESESLDRDASAKAAARDTRTAAPRTCETPRLGRSAAGVDRRLARLHPARP